MKISFYPISVEDFVRFLSGVSFEICSIEMVDFLILTDFILTECQWGNCFEVSFWYLLHCNGGFSDFGDLC